MKLLFLDTETGGIDPQKQSLLSIGMTVWTGFNGKPAKIYSKIAAQKDKIHPTQKTVELHSWLIHNYAKKVDKILDTHFFSASIALAIDKANKADNMELNFVGIALDKDYFDSAMRRFSKGRQQMFLNLNV